MAISKSQTRALPRMLGFIVVLLLPLRAFCDTSTLDLSPQRLQLAATDQITADTANDAESDTTPIFDPEFPHLDIPSQGNWAGLLDDTKMFLLYQVAVVGVLYLMPESTSQWSEEDKRGNIFRKWNDNVSSLRKDGDDWAINYIGHPFFGSVYYVRARYRGFDRQGAFWYATVMSTAYEYGIEALFEPASIQDLIFTPVGGAVLGEYLVSGRENIKRDIAAKGYADTSDNVLLFFTDPLGTVNEKVNRMFGNNDEKQTRLELFPMLSFDPLDHGSMEITGIQALLRW